MEPTSTTFGTKRNMTRIRTKTRISRKRRSKHGSMPVVFSVQATTRSCLRSRSDVYGRNVRRRRRSRQVNQATEGFQLSTQPTMWPLISLPELSLKLSPIQVPVHRRSKLHKCKEPKCLRYLQAIKLRLRRRSLRKHPPRPRRRTSNAQLICYDLETGNL